MNITNLSSETAVGAAFDVNNLDTTTDHASTIEVYDSLGQKHDLTLYFLERLRLGLECCF